MFRIRSICRHGQSTVIFPQDPKWPDEWVEKVQVYSSDVTDEDWEQPRMPWELFKKNGEDEDLIQNLTSTRHFQTLKSRQSVGESYSGRNIKYTPCALES